MLHNHASDNHHQFKAIRDIDVRNSRVYNTIRHIMYVYHIYSINMLWQKEPFKPFFFHDNKTSLGNFILLFQRFETISYDYFTKIQYVCGFGTRSPFRTRKPSVCRSIQYKIQFFPANCSQQSIGLHQTSFLTGMKLRF